MNRRIKRLALIVLAFVSYIALLWLLTVAESKDPNASIQTLWQALWYSMVTLSTVGYGDLYPVTPLGKVIGLLFVLLSLGLLAFLLGAIVSALTGKTLPLLRLWLHRKKKWYIFSECNDSTLALAWDIASGEPNCRLLFPLIDQKNLPAALPCLLFPGSIAQIAKYKKEHCTIFFMSEKSGSNYTLALAHTSLGHPIYCRTVHPQEHAPSNLTLFNRYHCCAQEYWHSLPLQASENKVVLLGDGTYAQHLLEFGLLANVFAPGHSVHYHVFGQWQDFRRNHPQLEMTLSLDQQDADQDCLFFHNTAWNADATLLEQADRIILCYDQEQDNLENLRHLRRYFVTTGKVHLRAKVAIPGEITFGTDQMIYTQQSILREQATETARAIHRLYQQNTNQTAPTWESLSDFTRQSNLYAAEHLLLKARMLLCDENIPRLSPAICAKAYQVYCQTKATHGDAYRRLEHLRWMRFHSMFNWRYAPVRNNALRQHPLLLPFDELSPTAQEANDQAWEMLDKLARNE